VFDTVAAGHCDPRATLDGQVRLPASGGSWFDDGEEQADRLSTALSGALPMQPTSSPDIGVYLDDATGTKVDYYVDYVVRLEPLSCTGSGAQKQRVIVTVTSNVPADAAAALPPSILGSSRPAGWLLTSLCIYAPVDGVFGSATLGGRTFLYAPYQHGVRAVAGATIELEPGQTRTMTYHVTSAPNQPGDPTCVSPGVHGSGTAQAGESDC